MAISETFKTWRAAAVLAAVLITTAEAGEKVRFGPAANVNIPTRPARSARESIQLQPSASLNQVSTPVPVQASSTVISRRSDGDDEDQRNWIFRDSRSAGSIQKALGVETFDEAAPAVADRDSVAVIQEYFSRQHDQTRGDLSNSKSGANLGSVFSQSSGLGASALSHPIGQAPNDTARSGGGDLFGASTFRNTLNSDNLTVRRYFRDLYTTPSSPSASRSAAPGGNSLTAGIANSQNRPTPFDQLRQERFSELANRAAVVNALSSDSPEDPRLNPTARALQPAPAYNGLPVVNEGKLFERRNGVIEIPARKF